MYHSERVESYSVKHNKRVYFAGYLYRAVPQQYQIHGKLLGASQAPATNIYSL